MGHFVSPLALFGVTILLIAAIALISKSRTNRRYTALGTSPPTSVASHVFGLDIFISMVRAVRNHEFHTWSQSLLKRHNHTMELRMLGENLIMTDDPENIKAIQETQYSEFAKSDEQREIFKHIFGDNLFGMNGAEWKAEAALYRTHLSRVRDSDLTATERHVVNSFALLDDERNDAADVADRLQLDVVTEVFCGESANSLTSDQSHFRTAMETLQKIASVRQLLGKVGVWLDDKLFAPKAVRCVDAYHNAIVDRAFLRAKSTNHTRGQSSCFLDELILQGKGRHDVKNAVISLLTAGKDPTATSLAFCLYEVAKRPEVFARMKAEVEEHIGTDVPPTLNDLRKLKYVKMVIKETLRNHHPPLVRHSGKVGYNPRIPVRDVTLPRGGGPGGRSPVAVLEGTQIIYSLLSVQNREDLGSQDAAGWHPERWETWKPASKWEFVPFNHGPRICLGQQFANVQLEYFFARFCQEYARISVSGKTRQQEGLMRLELNTKLAHPLYLRCTRRSK